MTFYTLYLKLQNISCPATSSWKKKVKEWDGDYSNILRQNKFIMTA